ncbi:MAG: hypothetical protein WAV16_01310 [Candidatus Moraniibacteriota bacterium]
MLWSQNIAVTINGKTVLIDGKFNYVIRLLGCSVEDVLGGEEGSSSFVVNFSNERDELLAVKIAGSYTFIYLQWKEDKISFDAQRNWIPSGDRLGIINPDGYIEMKTQGKLFSTDPNASDGVFFVGDANACCKFLVGHIDLEELMLAAQETQKQIDIQGRCAHLEQEAKYLQEVNSQLEANKAVLYEEIELSTINEYGWKEEKCRLIEDHEAELKALRKYITDWKEAATQLRDAVNSPFIEKRYGCSRTGEGFVFERRKTRIKKALELFPDKSLNDSV